MTCDFYKLPHEGIQCLNPYVPGKSADELQAQKGLGTIIKLASNENPLGCSELVTTALANLSTKQLAAYTISAQHPLNQKIATQLSLPRTMITLTNGSDLLFTLLLTCFALHRDKHVLTHDYAFITYQVQANTLGIPIFSTPLKNQWQVDVQAMVNKCNEKTAIIFLANPNNPTGLLIPEVEIRYLLDNIPATTLLVLDEAYYEFVDPTLRPNTQALLAHYPNLVLTRTFSKAYGLAGLRLGYAIACQAITDILHRALLPFTVNKAALEAGSAALGDQEFLQHTITNNIVGLKQLQQGLDELNIRYLPSHCNFVTFDCNKDTTILYQKLLKHGIIVRPLHPYAMNNFFRVTVGTREQNNQFITTFKELFYEK